MTATVPENLTGKIAFVTGASKGLGRAITRALVTRGARVALVARPSRDLDALAAELGAAVLACPCDLRDRMAIKQAVETAASHFGGLDIVINNAAACLPHLIETSTDDELLCEMEINLLAPIWITRQVIPHLKARGGGDLVMISSDAALIAPPHLTLYGASKAGLEAFAAGLRGELREMGTRVIVLRSGRMTGSSLLQGLSPGRIEAFMQAMAESGYLAHTGAGVDPATTAAALVEVLRLPREANVDTIQVTSRV